MYDMLDYSKISPFDLMNFLKLKKDKERIDKILKLGIFTVVDKELHIASYKCIKHKKIGNDVKKFKNWFSFNHQVFRFLLQDTMDIDFSITELKRILIGERSYTFPNGTYVELDK